MRSLIAVVPMLPACCWMTRACAQTAPASASGSGTVIGDVVCGDTQRPARFAAVVLFGIPAEVTVRPSLAIPSDSGSIQAAMKARFGSTKMVQGQTGLDGSFALSDLPPGDCFRHAGGQRPMQWK